MKKFFSYLIIALTAITLVACGTSVKDQEKNLVGTWRGETGTITLYDNKKAETRLDGVSETGTWSIEDGKLYIKRDGKRVLDLQATLPDGEFSSFEIIWIAKSTGKQHTDKSEMFMKE